MTNKIDNEAVATAVLTSLVMSKDKTPDAVATDLIERAIANGVPLGVLGAAARDYLKDVSFRLLMLEIDIDMLQGELEGKRYEPPQRTLTPKMICYAEARAAKAVCKPLVVLGQGDSQTKIEEADL